MGAIVGVDADGGEVAGGGVVTCECVDSDAAVSDERLVTRKRAYVR
jgi:hypothetical protein